MIVSDRVSERMKALGLSQSELARRVGVAQPTIYKLLHTSKKGSTKLHAIARELGTTPAYLSGETDDPNADAPPERELDHEQRSLIEHFSVLTEADRAAVVRIVSSLAAMSAGPTLHSPRTSFRAQEKGGKI